MYKYRIVINIIYLTQRIIKNPQFIEFLNENKYLKETLNEIIYHKYNIKNIHKKY